MVTTAFVLGNGSSREGVDLRMFSAVSTVGMGAGIREWERIGWYPTHYCCVDGSVIEQHHDAIESFISEGLVQSAFLAGRMLDFHPELAGHERCFFLDSFRSGPRPRARREKHVLPSAEEEDAFAFIEPSDLTTEACAVRYAILLGYRSLYLLGIDCDDDAAVPGSAHQLRALERTRDIVVDRRLPVEVSNCSPQSRLATEGTLPYADLDRALGLPRLGAIVIPMTFGEEHVLAANLKRWASPAAAPRFPTCGYPVSLILALNGHRDTAFESRIRTEFERAALSPSAFCSMEFVYCELEGEEDRYQRDYSRPAGPGGHKAGPNAQFFRTMELVRDRGPYIFMMETDCIPVRPNWLGELEGIVDGGEPFWVMGSVYRGRAGVDERYRLHLNGNAVYAVGDEGFWAFLHEVWRPALESCLRAVPTLAYDCVLPLYFSESEAAPGDRRWEIHQSILHRLRYTEFIQNHGSAADVELGQSLEEIRDTSPRTYIVHGRQFAPTSSAPVPREPDAAGSNVA